MRNRRLLRASVFCFVMGVLCLSCLTCATPAFAQTGPITAVIAGNVADLVSTEIALSRGGVHEVNPLMQTTARRVAAKAGATAFTVWAVKRIAPKSPKVAAVVGYSLGAVMGGIAVRNYRVMQEAR